MCPSVSRCDGPALGSVFVARHWFRAARGVAALLLSLTVGLTVVGSPATTAEGATPGFRAVTVKRIGVRIAFPDAWVVLDLTKPRKATVAQLAEARRNYPSLAGRLPEQPRAFVERDVKLFAVDPAAPEDYVSVQLQATDALPPQRVLERLYQRTSRDAEIVSAKVDGRRGYEATTANSRQLWVVGNHGVLALVFTTATTGDPRDVPALRTIMHSVHLLN
jgi:hypothetical protein